MTKANANAAANAQEQQAAQQQILRDLLALGKKNGRLTLKEISDALSHLELSSEDIDKVYETLETMGIEVETNGVLEKVIGDDDDSFEPEEVEEVPEEELVDTSAMAETFAIDDPVRMYLKEIGKVDLLSPEEEVTRPQSVSQTKAMPFRRRSAHSLKRISSSATVQRSVWLRRTCDWLSPLQSAMSAAACCSSI